MPYKNDRSAPSAHEQRLFEDLLCWFENEADDERLEGCSLTGVNLSPDKRTLTVLYLPLEGREEEADEALGESLYLLGDRVEACLNGRRPEIHLKYDRGAQNKRRVDAILGDLGEGGQENPTSQN